jgi:hypothetical protein
MDFPVRKDFRLYLNGHRERSMKYTLNETDGQSETVGFGRVARIGEN